MRGDRWPITPLESHKCQGIRSTSRAKKRFTTHCGATHLRSPDLVNRQFSATRPDALWVADFTYCSTWSGVVYVAAWTRRHTTLENLIRHTDAGSRANHVGSLQRQN